MKNNIFKTYFNTTKTWSEFAREVFDSDYQDAINCFLFDQYQKKKIIYPPQNLIFKAFDSISFKDLKVVIVGQDPYHGDAQANGLSFSVNNNIKIPPSLKNIFKEINQSLNLNLGETGDLTPWAKNGVLLLNSVLSVEKSKPASHNKIGWELFTNHVLNFINDKSENIVFLLWGKIAKKKGAFLNRSKHLILETSHPSPFSAYRGFLGCNHFSLCNEYLKKNNIEEIKWDLNY